MEGKTITLNTDIGVFEGFEDSNGVCVYRGIRYAAAPSGSRRWLPPEDITVCDRYQENRFGAMPVQRFGPSTYYSGAARKVQDLSPEMIEGMDEDCLFLNIWTKGTEEQKPVLLWIYGGSYLNGSGASPETAGAKLVERFPDIVVVSINYRLGVLGNLDLSAAAGDDRWPGRNLALLDQQSAMRWVNCNIRYFGGDPQNVTLCGHSAGSNGISHHLTSEESCKYFQKAICQSSFFPGNGFTTPEDSRRAGDRFLELSGKKSMQELLEMTTEELLDIQDGMLRTDWGDMKGKLFSPVEDDVILPKNAYNNLKNGFASDKPVLLGCSQGEYDQMYQNIPDLEEVKRQLLRRNRQLESICRIDNLVGQLKNLKNETRDLQLLMDIQNELNMHVPCVRLAQALAEKGRCFMYYVNWWTKERRSIERSPHGVLNGLLFGTIYQDTGKTLSRQVQDAWVSFMKTGTPSCQDAPEWMPYSIENQETMIIDDRWELKEKWREEEFMLLNDLV